MHIIQHGEPLAPLFKPGTILWRSVAHFSSEHSPLKCRLYERKVEDYFERSDRGSYIGRVALNGGSGDFIREPVALPNRQEGKQISLFGLVLFVDALPPEDWTHLIVTGVSNVLKKPYDKTVSIRRMKGGAIFATVPEKPYPMADYLTFRDKIGTYMAANLNTDLEKLVPTLLHMWPDGDPRPETCRLVSEFYYRHPENLLTYCHLRQLPIMVPASV